MTRYLQRIEDQLTLAAGQTALQIRLTRSSKLYAGILANRVQYLSAGLVNRLENEMELASLLTHQLAHRQIARVRTAQAAGISVYLPPCVLSPFGTPGRRHRRNQEHQANTRALNYLKAAGYDQSGLLDLFSKLAYENPLWRQTFADLLRMRSVIESEELTPDECRVNSSESSEQYDNLHTVPDPTSQHRSSAACERTGYASQRLVASAPDNRGLYGSFGCAIHVPSIRWKTPNSR
jgi:hypothetical protein